MQILQSGLSCWGAGCRYYCRNVAADDNVNCKMTSFLGSAYLDAVLTQTWINAIGSGQFGPSNRFVGFAFEYRKKTCKVVLSVVGCTITV